MSGVDIDKSSLSNSKEGVAAYASEAQQDPLESVECDAVYVAISRFLSFVESQLTAPVAFG